MRQLDLLAVLVGIAALLPVAFVLLAAFDAGWATATRLIWRPRIGQLLIDTALLVGMVVPLTAMLSLALAWLTERTDLPRPQLWRWLATVPLAIPAFVHSYAWTSIAPSLHGLPAGVLVATLAYYPFMYLPIAAMLRKLDPALEETAAALGRPPLQVFLRVVLPQLRLAFCGGALLVGLHLLGEYGLFALIRFDTFTTAIIDQFQSSYSGPPANMMAVVLVLICSAFLTFEALLRGRRRFARLGSGASRAASQIRLGATAGPAFVLLIGTTVLGFGVPLLTLLSWLFTAGVGAWEGAAIWAALGQTVTLAAAGAMATVVAAAPMAWLSVRATGRWRRILEAAYYASGSLPGVVVSLGLVSVTVHVLLPLYQTYTTLICAYVLMFLPRALISLRASIAQAPVELEQVAWTLGRSPGRAVRSITVRLAAPGIAAGAALVALGISNELVATQMLAPSGTRTLAMAFWSASSELDYAAAAPYAILMVLMSLPLTWLLHAASDRSSGR